MYIVRNVTSIYIPYVYDYKLALYTRYEPCG